MEAVEKIKSWLNEENKYIITEEQHSGQRYLLKVENKQENSHIPFYVFSPLDSENTNVAWSWSLLPEYVEGLKITGDEVKKQIYQDLLAGAFLSHVNMRTVPSIVELNSDMKLNLQQIDAQKVIRSDGLTKDRLLDTILQIIDMYGYTISLFGKYKLYHPPFDPSSLV